MAFYPRLQAGGAGRPAVLKLTCCVGRCSRSFSRTCPNTYPYTCVQPKFREGGGGRVGGGALVSKALTLLNRVWTLEQGF